jgi:hypothetical protein
VQRERFYHLRNMMQCHVKTKLQKLASLLRLNRKCNAAAVTQCSTISFESSANKGLNVQYDCIPSSQLDVMQLSGKHTLDFHLLCDRQTHTVKIFAGAFVNGHLRLSKINKINKIEDAFANNLMLWRPSARDVNGIPTSGSWIEVSVLGHGYSVGNRERLDVGESWNLLEDYSIICTNGSTFLWMSRYATAQPFDTKDITCPITLDRIPTLTLSKSISIDSLKSHERLQSKTTTELFAGRPWFFNKCG